MLFEKPRTVYWEYLFASKQSPLRNIWKDPHISGDFRLYINDSWFGLQIDHPKQPSGAKIAEVPNSIGRKIDSTLAFSFGCLLGYSHFFGIFDLHRGNIHLTKAGFQIIDIEVCLGRMVLPHESLLLPFKSIGFEQCGASIAFADVDELRKYAPEVLRGYWSFCQLLTSLSGQINCMLTSYASLPLFPRRVILRKTQDYLRHLSGEVPILDLIPQEAVQLDRGDIPYFFFRHGDFGTLRYYDTETSEITFIPNATHLDVTQRLQTSFSDWWSDPKKLFSMQVQGILYLTKFLLAPKQELHLPDLDLQIKNCLSHYEIHHCQRTYTTRPLNA